MFTAQCTMLPPCLCVNHTMFLHLFQLQVTVFISLLSVTHDHRLNSLAGGGKPYFKAVCSSDDETLVFPSSCDDMFCQQMALCMAELHPSKR